MGVVIGAELFRRKDGLRYDLPVDKGKISIRHPATDEPRAVATLRHLLLCEITIQHAGHALDLVNISLPGTGELLRVEFLKPHRLTVYDILLAQPTQAQEKGAFFSAFSPG